MSLAYIDHQRTRFWRTHEEIFDFRRTRDTNWLELTTARKDREETRTIARETRRSKWEDERRDREKADQLYLQKREDERLARREHRKHEHQESSLSHIYNKRDNAWNNHVEDRTKFRERQSQRLIEDKKEADHELEEIKNRQEALKERQVLRAARAASADEKARETEARLKERRMKKDF